jgi:hypothetical protein
MIVIEKFVYSPSKDMTCLLDQEVLSKYKMHFSIIL